MEIPQPDPPHPDQNAATTPHYTTSVANYLITQSHTENDVTLLFHPAIATLPEAAKYRLVSPLLADPTLKHIYYSLRDPSFDGLSITYPVNKTFEHLTPSGSYSFLAAVFLIYRHQFNSEFVTDANEVQPTDELFQAFIVHLKDHTSEPLKSYATRIAAGGRGKVSESLELITYTLHVLKLNATFAVIADVNGLLQPIAMSSSPKPITTGITYESALTSLTVNYTIFRDPQLQHYTIAAPAYIVAPVERVLTGLSDKLHQKFKLLTVPQYPVFPLRTLTPNNDGLSIASQLLNIDQVALQTSFSLANADPLSYMSLYPDIIIRQFYHAAELRQCIIDILSPKMSLRLGSKGPIAAVLYSADTVTFEEIPGGYSHTQVPVQAMVEQRPAKSSPEISSGPGVASLLPVSVGTEALLRPHEVPLITTKHILIANISYMAPPEITAAELVLMLSHYRLAPAYEVLDILKSPDPYILKDPNHRSASHGIFHHDSLSFQTKSDPTKL